MYNKITRIPECRNDVVSIGDKTYNNNNDVSLFLPQMEFWVNKENNHIGTNQEQEAVVVFMTDDGYVTDRTIIMPYLQSKGFSFTVLIVTSWMDTGGLYLSTAQCNDLNNAGMDLAMHSNYHYMNPGDPEYENLTDAQMLADLLTAIAWFTTRNYEIPDCGTPPRYAAWYPNVRKNWSQYFSYMAFGIYNHCISWTKSMRQTLGRMPCQFAADADVVDAKLAVDVCKVLKEPLIIYAHNIVNAAYEARFNDLIDYIEAQGLKIITMKDFCKRFENNQSYYIDKAGRNRYLQTIMEQNSFEPYNGHVVFGCTLLELGVVNAEKFVNVYNYRISFLNDTTDAAFKYVVKDDSFRSYLQGIGITSAFGLIQSGTSIVYQIKPLSLDLKDFGLDYFLTCTDFNLNVLANLKCIIPRSVGNMVHIKYFRIMSAKLYGSIPVEFSKLLDLEYIDLNTNSLTGYEQGAFSLHHCKLNNINLSANAFTVEAVNQILIDIRDMVKLQKRLTGFLPPHPDYLINISGGTSAAPTGAGAVAKAELQNAIAVLGAANNWTVTTN